MTFSKELLNLAQLVINTYREKGKMITLAESCTGGLISSLLTEIPGSSAVLDRGFVVYSNEAKMELLQVKSETLEKFGAVSAETAMEMAQGALLNSRAQIAVAVTGIAGPGGGTAEKPVGLVFVGWKVEGREPEFLKLILGGDRQEVRAQTVEGVMKLLFEVLTF
ncbi:MAG: CinA family protein [Bacteroidia bacterium]